MKLFFQGIIFLTISLISHEAQSHEVNVAFEAFPPVITEDGNGIAVNMLREIEEISDYRFNIQIMTYGRGKRELQNNRADLLGLTPKNSETSDFYQYATELDWELPAKVDIFVIEKKHLNNIKKIIIGVPIGNADFFSELFALPRDNIVEVTNLSQLVKMLKQKRVDAVLFDRISVLSTFKKLKIDKFYYQHISTLGASMAVRNTQEGKKLKKALDKYIIQLAPLFAEYQQFVNMPNTGNEDTVAELMKKIK